MEAREALEQLSTTTGRIINNVPTVQTIDQIIGVVSDQFQAQQLCDRCGIQERRKSTNACFAALAEQMQQLISMTVATACNPSTPRPPPVTLQFHGEETCDIYILNKTLGETEPAQVFARPPVDVKPKAPSTDTLHNNEFSHTPRGEEEASCSAPQRRPQPAANPFGFSDYPPEDYFDHLQPQYKLPRTSHCENDSRIKTIIDNMHPLIITEPQQTNASYASLFR
uniref:Uncharacterized protein n=1 Tax=Romanomermis culicivorax TaxID=13658 RepID=A0A915KT50_ROMCU